MEHFILEINNQLSADVCAFMIEKFEQDTHKQPGTVGAGYRPDIKRSLDLFLTDLPEWKDIDTLLFEHLTSAVKLYSDKFPILERFRLRDRGYQIQRTEVGEHYTWHADVGNKHGRDRVYVAIWYLNNVVEGGETEFKYQEYKVTPQVGKLVLFPAGWTHVHQGVSPISNTKYICVAWLCFAD